MNILLVSQMMVNSKTGVTTYYQSLKNEYVSRGHFVQIITPAETPKVISFFLKIFRRVLIIFRSDYQQLVVFEFIYFVSIYFAAKKIRKKKKWDIIHGQDASSSCAARFAFRNKVPIVTTCHFNDNPVEERRLKYKLSKRQLKKVTKWYTFLFSKVNNYIFVSEYIHKKSAFLFSANINYEIIPNGVKFFEKKEISDITGHFVVSNVGTIEDRKNQILLIEAASVLSKKDIPFYIYLFGEGPKADEWKKKVKEMGLEKFVFFKGHIKNILNEISNTHLYVHTSLNESWGLCITEAFSIGLPVLALANGGIGEQFPKSKAGLLPSEITAVELANIISLHLNKHRRNQLQNEQYEFASLHFTANNMINKTLDFYKSIINKASKTEQKNEKN